MLDSPTPRESPGLLPERGPVRRWVAVLFLVLIAFYLGAADRDGCDRNPKADAPVCQLLCADGCATAPLPVTPMPPAADPLPREPRRAERPMALASLDIEPEKEPPRV